MSAALPQCLAVLRRAVFSVTITVFMVKWRRSPAPPAGRAEAGKQGLALPEKAPVSGPPSPPLSPRLFCRADRAPRPALINRAPGAVFREPFSAGRGAQSSRGRRGKGSSSFLRAWAGRRPPSYGGKAGGLTGTRVPSSLRSSGKARPCPPLFRGAPGYSAGRTRTSSVVPSRMDFSEGRSSPVFSSRPWSTKRAAGSPMVWAASLQPAQMGSLEGLR